MTGRFVRRNQTKKRNNRQKQLPAQRDKVVAAIEAAEARKAEILALFCEPGYGERTLKSTSWLPSRIQIWFIGPSSSIDL